MSKKLLGKQIPVFEEAKQKLDKYGMVYIAAEMRFGKAYITSALIEHYNYDALICTVKSAVEGWGEALDYFNIGADIINYESLHKVNTKKYDVIVVDEAPKISAFPKKNKARAEIDRFIHKDLKVIWLSGTPSIESNAQWFHQLSISPRHSFSLYKKKGNSSAFNLWYFGSSYYKDRGNLPGYGYRTMKRIGYNKEAWDYADVKPFPEKIDPMLIRRFHEEENMSVRAHLRYVEATKTVSEVYHTILTQKCSQELKIEPLGGAQLLSKLHQIANGHYIGENGTVILDAFKAKVVYKEHPNAIVFYKYQADREVLLSVGYLDEQLLQIDSNVMGLDLSHYDEAVIYSLTFSGQNYTQCLSRLNNHKKKEIPNFYIYLTKNTLEKDIYDVVSQKKDYNAKWLRS